MDFQGEFDFAEDEQQENLERISSRIGRAIAEYCQLRRRFHADELCRWVIRETGIAAPASADRVLRDLRQRGVIDYQVLNRRDSLYAVTRVPDARRA